MEIDAKVCLHDKEACISLHLPQVKSTDSIVPEPSDKQIKD